MSDNLRDFTKATDGFDAVVRQVGPDQWDNRTPCHQWVARDVVEHVIGAYATITTMAAGTQPPHGGEPATDDVAGRWSAAKEDLMSALESPGALERENQTPFGQMTVDRFLGIYGLDPLVHSWDLARAVGREPELDEDLVDRYHGQLTRAGDAIRGEGMFAAAVDPPADATPVEAFIAFTGRDPRA